MDVHAAPPGLMSPVSMRGLPKLRLGGAGAGAGAGMAVTIPDTALPSGWDDDDGDSLLGFDAEEAKLSLPPPSPLVSPSDVPRRRRKKKLRREKKHKKPETVGRALSLRAHIHTHTHTHTHTHSRTYVLTLVGDHFFLFLFRFIVQDAAPKYELFELPKLPRRRTKPAQGVPKNKRYDDHEKLTYMPPGTLVSYYRPPIAYSYGPIYPMHDHTSLRIAKQRASRMVQQVNSAMNNMTRFLQAWYRGERVRKQLRHLTWHANIVQVRVRVEVMRLSARHLAVDTRLLLVSFAAASRGFTAATPFDETLRTCTRWWCPFRRLSAACSRARF